METKENQRRIYIQMRLGQIRLELETHQKTATQRGSLATKEAFKQLVFAKERLKELKTERARLRAEQKSLRAARAK